MNCILILVAGKRESPAGNVRPGFYSVLTAGVGDEAAEARRPLLPGCLAAACTAGVAPAEAAYSSPHLQSELVTDHLHFKQRPHPPGRGESSAVALPSRRGESFKGDCRHDRGGDSQSPLSLCLGFPFTAPPPDSSSRQRLAGNAYGLPDPHLKAAAVSHALACVPAHEQYVSNSIRIDQANFAHSTTVCRKDR